MKMSEFMDLPEDGKEEEIAKCDGEEDPYTSIVEVGACLQCGKPVDIGDYCFGCKKLVCRNCFEEEPHLGECVA